MSVGTPELQLSYDAIRREAVALAGDPDDIPQRAALLHGLFLDSKKNHPFPEIAMHSALWLQKFYGDAENYLHRARLNELDRQQSLDSLRIFVHELKEANRNVFIDTYTNYFFTRYFGQMPGADRISGEQVLAMFEKIHLAARDGSLLSPPDLKEAFSTCLIWEQRNSVSVGVRSAYKSIQSPMLQAYCSRPVVRLAYFPFFKLLHFKNFVDPQERIFHAVESFELAVEAGWDTVWRSVASYRIMPEAFLGNPAKYTEDLKLRLLSHRDV